MDAVEGASFDGDEGLRSLAVAKAQQMCRRIERPWDRVGRIIWEEVSIHQNPTVGSKMTDHFVIQPMHAIAIKVGIDMGLFEQLQDNPDSPKTSRQLATLTHSEHTLVQRVLRSLAATYVVSEVEHDSYMPNSMSTALATAEVRGSLSFLFEVRLPLYHQIPLYFREQDFRDPTGPKDCPWSVFGDREKTWFEWLQANPERLKEFFGLMSGFSTSRAPWYEVYPLERIWAGLEETGPILVDVAGGIGDSIQGFCKRYPQCSGRLILQDLPAVIAKAAVNEDQVKKMSIDLFETQPMTNARVYLLRSILHDWPDDKAKDILLHLRPSMRKGYSKILVNEIVLDGDDLTPTKAAIDLMVMSFMGSKERTEEEWKLLFLSAGMKVTGRWKSQVTDRDVLEVDLED